MYQCWHEPYTWSAHIAGEGSIQCAETMGHVVHCEACLPAVVQGVSSTSHHYPCSRCVSRVCCAAYPTKWWCLRCCKPPRPWCTSTASSLPRKASTWWIQNELNIWIHPICVLECSVISSTLHIFILFSGYNAWDRWCVEYWIFWTTSMIYIHARCLQVVCCV